MPAAERTVTDPPSGGEGPDAGAPAADAERTAPGVPQAAGGPAHGGAQGGPDGRSAPRMPATGTLVVARSDADSGTKDTSGPALTPDAILPPGISPETPPEQPNDLGETATGPIPRLGPGPYAGGSGRRPSGSSGARRALLAAGGLLGVVVLGGVGALGYTKLSASPEAHKVVQAPPPSPTLATPTPTPVKRTPKPKPRHKQPVDIRDEKKDPAPLTIGEVFPSHRLKLAGHTFTLAKAVINDHCDLTASRPFSDELTRQHCRRVVRATFVSEDKKLAVTTGIAAMPTDAAASAVMKVQDPAHYKWFRGMKATGAPKIDQAGGFAAGMTRGRYIIYAYAMYADGHRPAKTDKTLKTVGGAFRNSTERAIARRARH